MTKRNEGKEKCLIILTRDIKLQQTFNRLSIALIAFGKNRRERLFFFPLILFEKFLTFPL